LTSTLEIYKTDRLGSTFAFVDFDYNNEGSSGFRNASLAYGEIARYFQLPKVKNLSATLQYNDGLTNSGSLNAVWLGGVQYIFQIGQHTFPIDFLLLKEVNTGGLTFQLTYIWSYNWRKLELGGFIDLWNTGANGYPPRKIVILSEP